MLPAHKRFDFGDPARFQIDDRLIIDAELAQADRTTHIQFKLQAFHSTRIHAAVEDGIVCFAAGLGTIHRHVGVAQEIVGMVLAGSTERDTDTGGCEYIVAGDIERRHKLVGDALSQVDRFVDIGDFFQQDRELVATEAS